MRRISRLLMPFLGIPLLFAQDPIKSEPTDLTIKAYTKLVQVPVIVRDKSGQPVKGLTKDDFVLYEDGKVVKISNFQASTSAEERSQLSVAGLKLPPGEYTNVGPRSRPVERPVVLLMIDATSISFLIRPRRGNIW